MFSGPILGPTERDTGVYVLLEKDIRNGQYTVVNVSDTRQAITNERQERVVFNRELTRYAPDFSAAGLSTYTDRGNYDQQSVITDCEGRSTRKTVEYSLCSSEFSAVFIPTSVTKSYVAGRMSYETHQRWKHPRINWMREVGSPTGVLIEAGVFENMGQLVLANHALAVTASANDTAPKDSPSVPENSSVVLEVNNAWQVFEGKRINAPLFVTIEQRDTHWDITDIHDVPQKIARNDAREVFMVSRDLQYWEAYGPKSATGCDTFEAREYPYKSLCTSVFAEKQVGRAILGVFFSNLGNGAIPMGYNAEKVTAAIRSIRPAQAQTMLDAFDGR